MQKAYKNNSFWSNQLFSSFLTVTTTYIELEPYLSCIFEQYLKAWLFPSALLYFLLPFLSKWDAWSFPFVLLSWLGQVVNLLTHARLLTCPGPQMFTIGPFQEGPTGVWGYQITPFQSEKRVQWTVGHSLKDYFTHPLLLVC